MKTSVTSTNSAWRSRRTANVKKKLQLQLSSARKALEAGYNFFREGQVPVALKVELAQMLILSKLSYGAEIMHLSATQERKVDGFPVKVLKTILRVPNYASGFVLRHILDRHSLSTQRRISRVANFLRIRQMPPHTRLRGICDSRAWHKAILVFGRNERDVQEVRSERHLSSVTETALEEALQCKISAKARRSIKKVSTEADLAMAAHYLRKKHSELLHFNATDRHPIWRFVHYLSALIRDGKASLGAACDDWRD